MSKFDGNDSKSTVQSCSETRKSNSLSKVSTMQVQECASTFSSGLNSIASLAWLGVRLPCPLLVNFEKETTKMNMSERVGRNQIRISTNCSIEHVVFQEDGRGHSKSRSSSQKPFHPVPRCFHTHTHTHTSTCYGFFRLFRLSQAIGSEGSIVKWAAKKGPRHLQWSFLQCRIGDIHISFASKKMEKTHDFMTFGR